MVTKLTATGTIAYSTFVGGGADDIGYAITVDSSGNAYIAGDTDSTDFPATFDALQSTTTGAFNTFVAQINTTASALGYATYLGGSGFETAYGIALDSSVAPDSSGRLPAWVAGYTVSTDFPVTTSAAQANLAGGWDALVMKVVGCTYSLASSSSSPLSAGGPGTVGLTASLSGCPWTTSSNATWLTATASGLGTTTVNYSVAVNTGVARLGVLTIAGMPFTVNQAGAQPQTITFGALSNVNFGTAPFMISATASSTLTVTFVSTALSVCTISGSTVTILAPGTCSITASQAGNTSYLAATPVSQSFTVNQEPQTITFGALGNVTFGAAPFTLSATASSTLPVAFTSTTLPVCTTSGSNGSTVTVLAGGSCSITANQAVTQPSRRPLRSSKASRSTRRRRRLRSVPWPTSIFNGAVRDNRNRQFQPGRQLCLHHIARMHDFGEHRDFGSPGNLLYNGEPGG